MQYSTTPGGAFPADQITLDHTRRKFNLGEGVAMLDPRTSPFYVYLRRAAVNPTNDSVFKFMEERTGWARRYIYADDDGGGLPQTVTADANGQFSFDVYSDVDQYGKSSSSKQIPLFLLKEQVIRLSGAYDADGGGAGAEATETINARIVEAPVQGAGVSTIKVELLGTSAAVQANTSTFKPTLDTKFLLAGSAHVEGAGVPDAWGTYQIYPTEGYSQIFRDACPMMSGSGMATEYRGRANEFRRIWRQKLKEHKIDMENGSLFGIGHVEDTPTGPRRYTWGVVPAIELLGGRIYNVQWDVNSANAGAGYFGGDYDGFLHIMEDFFDPTIGNSGDKLVLASRSVITFLNSLQDNSFLGNTVGTSQYRLDIANVPGAFGHNVTRVNTVHGNLHIVQEPLFRGVNDDLMVMVDMNNVQWRPLAGNGINRDTYIETNVQARGVDGRQDQILTEAGLKVDLIETHGMVRFSNKN